MRQAGRNPGFQGRFLPLAILLLCGLSSTAAARRMQQIAAPAADWQMLITGSPVQTADCTLTSVVLGGRTITIPTGLPIMYPASADTWDKTNVGAPCTDLVLTINANMVGSSITAGTVDVDHVHAVVNSGYITSIPADGASLVVDTTTIILNDPFNAYSTGSATQGGQARFSVDTVNPTVAAATGYPMCIPSLINPNCTMDQNRWPARSPTLAVGAAPVCTQRDASADGLLPTFVTRGVSTAAATTIGLRGQNPYQYIVSPLTCNATSPTPMNPFKKAAFQVGDYITYSGYQDLATGKIFVYSIIASQLSLLTESGWEPAYASWETAVHATSGSKVAAGPATVLAAEQTIRTRFEGVTTDPFRPIRVAGVDFRPDGTTTFREYGLIMPDYGAQFKGAQMGRWRMRPPCTLALPDTGNAGCTLPFSPLATGGGNGGGGNGNKPATFNWYYPAPRELAAVPSQSPATDPAKNLTRTWYQNPTIEYLLGEGLPGSPPVADIFYDLLYLQGGYFGASPTVTPFPNSASTLNTYNALPGFPTSQPDLAPAVTDLQAAASYCGTSLYVCAWFTVPAGKASTNMNVYLLPYFGGSNQAATAQFPANYDFTLARTSVIPQFTFSTTTLPLQKGCIKVSAAAKPQLSLQVVVRPATLNSIMGDTYTIPVSRITFQPTDTGTGVCNADITTTSLAQPGARYGFAPPYLP